MRATGYGNGKKANGNGGFRGQPTVTFDKIDEDKWNSIDWGDYKKDDKWQDEK